MRKVNYRSRQLRHYNSGASSNNYFSKLWQIITNFRNNLETKKDFSVNHNENRYDSFLLPEKNNKSGNLFLLKNSKKYFTHAGIIAVGIFTILSNTCLGPFCDTSYQGSYLASAKTNSDKNLIEINLDQSANAQPIISNKKLQQLASTISDYSPGADKTSSNDIDVKNNSQEEQQNLAIIQNSYLEKISSPVTNISDAPRKNVITHLVKADETLSSISDKYQVSTDTIRWSNGMDNSGMLIEGQELYIMPIDGIYYTVQDGDSISSISEKYKSSLDDINKWNDFNGEDISIGQKIILPGGKVPVPPKPIVVESQSYPSNDNNNGFTPSADSTAQPLAGSGQFGWPTSGMTITQYFGATDFNPWHTGIDVDSRSGWDIFAADGGTITNASYGWGGGYGNHVMIDHGNGYVTLYGHLSALDVSVGQTVSKGQRIGTMGSTGWSTGPHLHFEIRYNGSFLNPLNYL